MSFSKFLKPKFLILRKLEANSSNQVALLEKPTTLEQNEILPFGDLKLEQTPVFELTERQKQLKEAFLKPKNINTRPSPELKTQPIIEKTKNFFGNLSKFNPKNTIENLKLKYSQKPSQSQTPEIVKNIRNVESSLNLESLPIGTIIEISTNQNKTEIINGEEIKLKYLPPKKFKMVVSTLKDGKTKGVSPYKEEVGKNRGNSGIPVSEIKVGQSVVIGDQSNSQNSRNLGTLTGFSYFSEGTKNQEISEILNGIKSAREFVNNLTEDTEKMPQNLKNNQETLKAYSIFLNKYKQNSSEAKTIYEKITSLITNLDKI